MNRTLSISGGIIGTLLSASGALISAEQLDHIISIICAVLGVIIVLITSLLIPLIKWWKKAKEDGKITKEELEEGKEIVTRGVEEVKNSIENNKK